MLGPGDLIFHPRNGFGTIRGLTRRDPFQPSQDGMANDSVSDQAQDYYDIQLTDGGTLLVPVNRAKRLGLRLLTNGVDAITMCLRSPAQACPAMPGNGRRAVGTWPDWRADRAGRLGSGYGDAESRSNSHGQREKWLNKSCDRLSTEAALVDRIPRLQAQAAIWEAVNQLSAP